MRSIPAELWKQLADNLARLGSQVRTHLLRGADRHDGLIRYESAAVPLPTAPPLVTQHANYRYIQLPSSMHRVIPRHARYTAVGALLHRIPDGNSGAHCRPAFYGIACIPRL